MSQRKYIVVAGNIGAGKSSLVKVLSAKLACEPYYEPVLENPYLQDFYADMQRWAFHSQLYFMTHRIKSHLQLARESGNVIQDRSLYEDAEVFARNLFVQGIMSEREWNTYTELYAVARTMLPVPDMVIYLRASIPTLRKRIALRGREFENSIPDEYLAGLNVLYEDWIQNSVIAPTTVVDGDVLDFVNERGHLEYLIEEIRHRLSESQGELFPLGGY